MSVPLSRSFAFHRVGAGALALALALLGGGARGQAVSPVDTAPARGAERSAQDAVFALRGPELLPPAPRLQQGGMGWVGWGLLSLAGVSGATALGAAMKREAHAQRWNDARCLVPGLTRAEVCSDERDSARTAEHVALVGAALTGLFAFGFVLHAAVSADTAVPRSAGSSCGLAGDRLGVACNGSF